MGSFFAMALAIPHLLSGDTGGAIRELDNAMRIVQVMASLGLLMMCLKPSKGGESLASGLVGLLVGLGFIWGLPVVMNFAGQFLS